MPNERNLEILNAAYEAFLRDESARNESILLDSAMDCGMPYEEPSVREWAAIRLADWLSAENECDCGAHIHADETHCRPCAAEYRAERYAMSEEF